MPSAPDDFAPEDNREQAKQFADDLDSLIRRYSDEYDLELYEIVGLLHTQIFVLEHRTYMANEIEDDEDDE